MRRTPTLLLSALASATLLSSAAPLAAQELDGMLLDGRTRQPVSRAVVVLLDSAGGQVSRAQTRADGRFRLRAAEPGVYRVRAELAGDLLVTGTVRLPPGETVEVEMLTRTTSLAAAARGDSAIRLDPLEAVAEAQRRYLTNAGFYDRQRVGTGVFLTSEQFMTRPGARIIDRVQGLRQVFARPAGTNGWILYQQGSAHRGSRRCIVSLWVDGMQMAANMLNQIRPEDVEAVEVYDGDEVPLRFSPVNRAGIPPCGAVVFWLKAPVNS
ncbi:MAG TPA: carboxypeptidase-like regulatory domain-containing protein [Longimicrobium sp.]|jgi:hypothetical protein